MHKCIKFIFISRISHGKIRVLPPEDQKLFYDAKTPAELRDLIIKFDAGRSEVKIKGFLDIDDVDSIYLKNGESLEIKEKANQNHVQTITQPKAKVNGQQSAE